MKITNGQDALAGASSEDWETRAEAGRWLAQNARRSYRDTLLSLLTDAQNTAVSMGTAEAILEHVNEFTLSLVFIALASADDETVDHLLSVMMPFLRQPSPTIALRQAMDRCLASDDAEVAAGCELAGLR